MSITREQLKIGNKYSQHYSLFGVELVYLNDKYLCVRHLDDSLSVHYINNFLNEYQIAPRPKKKIKLNYWLSGKDVVIVTDNEQANTNYTNMCYKLIKSEEIEIEE